PPPHVVRTVLPTQLLGDEVPSIEGRGHAPFQNAAAEQRGLGLVDPQETLVEPEEDKQRADENERQSRRRDNIGRAGTGRIERTARHGRASTGLAMPPLFNGTWPRRASNVLTRAGSSVGYDPVFSGWSACADALAYRDSLLLEESLGSPVERERHPDERCLGRQVPGSGMRRVQLG